MGTVRSLTRKYFHVYNLVPDFTPEAFTSHIVILGLVDYRGDDRVLCCGQFCHSGNS